MFKIMIYVQNGHNLMDYDPLTLLSILFDKYKLLNSNSMNII